MRYLITSICDENGNGDVTFSVTEEQLISLLEADLVYEDTVSEYTETSHRRHFHPNWDVTDEFGILRFLMVDNVRSI